MTREPVAFNQVIGNVAAIERIKTEIADKNGLGGCVFFLQGETGNGKTMLADIIADMADGDVYSIPLRCCSVTLTGDSADVAISDKELFRHTSLWGLFPSCRLF